ncbi:MAG: ACT domain-containing protein, partial [Actinomycetales bacterium]
PVVHAAPRIEVIVDDASPGDQVRAHAVRPVILEVRAHDAPGLLHRIAGAIAEAGATITGAKVATLGSEVVDVFFLADARGRPLTADRQQAVLVAVRRALGQQIA